MHAHYVCEDWVWRGRSTFQQVFVERVAAWFVACWKMATPSSVWHVWKMQSKRRVPVLCVGSFCGMFKASSASKQHVQEYRERSEARDCQQPRLLLGKLLPSSPPPFYPGCRTLSEGGGCSPVSRRQPEPSHSRSGSFRRPGLPGESAGPKRNGNMKRNFLYCSCVGVAVVEGVFFLWASKHHYQRTSHVHPQRCCVSRSTSIVLWQVYVCKLPPHSRSSKKTSGSRIDDELVR